MDLSYFLSSLRLWNGPYAHDLGRCSMGIAGLRRPLRALRNSTRRSPRGNVRWGCLQHLSEDNGEKRIAKRHANIITQLIRIFYGVKASSFRNIVDDIEKILRAVQGANETIEIHEDTGFYLVQRGRIGFLSP